MYDYKKLIDELVKVGIQEEYIKKEYRISIRGVDSYVADIAIVKGDVVIAVFEIKNGIEKDFKLTEHKLYDLRNIICKLCSNATFYVVCNDCVAEVTDRRPFKWNNIGSYFSKNKVHEWMAFPAPYTISNYLSAIYSEQNNLKVKYKKIVKFFYRGQSDKSYELQPSLFRKFINGNSYYKEEEFVLNEAIRLYPDAFSKCKTDIDKMTVAQHYSIPTRLLDITGSALVALYFAVSNKSDTDGAVFIFGVSANDYRLASKRGQDEKMTIKECREGNNQTSRMPYCILPTFRTSRQMAQDGAFYLFDNESNSETFRNMPIDCCAKIVISKWHKQKLLKELEDVCNIHKGTLFPESLDFFKDKIVNEAKLRIIVDEVNRLKKEIK